MGGGGGGVMPSPDTSCRQQLFQSRQTQKKYARKKWEANGRHPKPKRTQADAPRDHNGRARTHAHIRTDASIACEHESLTPVVRRDRPPALCPTARRGARPSRTATSVAGAAGRKKPIRPQQQRDKAHHSTPPPPAQNRPLLSDTGGGGVSNWPPGILADPPTHPPTSENFSSGKK